MVRRDQHVLLPQHLACLAQGQDRHERLDPAPPELPRGAIDHPIENGTMADQPSPRFISNLVAPLGEDWFRSGRDLGEWVGGIHRHAPAVLANSRVHVHQSSIRQPTPSVMQAGAFWHELTKT